jgi:superfamily II RNA helicase
LTDPARQLADLAADRDRSPAGSPPEAADSAPEGPPGQRGAEAPLPASIVEFQSRYPYPFDPFQVDAMRALARGSSVLVAAPTGTGKTVIAEFGVYLAHQAGLRAVYTTPIKALSNQKYRDFKLVFGDQVGLLTGDVVVNPGGRILVMTTEVLRNMVVQLGQPLADVGAIVFDEVHYVGDRERGTAWEEAILLSPPGVPLICLSATVPNVVEVAAWLRAARGDLECILHDERAVPLEHRYFLEGEAHLVVDARGRRRKTLQGVGGELAGRYRRAAAWGDRPQREPRVETPPWEVVRFLEQRRLTPAIYFLFSRRACETAAESCLALGPLPDGEALAREARARLADLPPEDRALRQVGLLLRLLPCGVAVHHAGLLPVIKMVVEEFFAAGRLRAVFATDTLALGINMPARTVVIGEMSKWDGEQHRLLTPNEYRQMTGRAGRRGIDSRGVSVVLYSPWVPFERAMEVVQGELLPLESAFAPHYSTAVNLWHRPADRDRLAELYARSLRRFQQDTRLEELSVEQEQLADAFRARGQARDPEAWRLGRELGQVERELSLARRAAADEARVLVDGLAEVLDRYGYLERDRPGAKASLLRHIFDTNALTLSELLAARVLEGLPAAEVAEVASWFAFDRDSPLRPLPLPRRLQRLHAEVLVLNAEILAVERRHGLTVSEPLNEEFRGVALAWAEGRPLGEIADRARLAEGDLVGLLQKTLDLLGQLRAAVVQRAALPTATARRTRQREAEPDWDTLLERLEAADALLRRGVVEASYRWALAGPPDAAAAEAASSADWPAPLPSAPPARRPAARRPTDRPRPTRRSAGSRAAAPDQRPERPATPPGRRKPKRQPRTGGPPRRRRRR